MFSLQTDDTLTWLDFFIDVMKLPATVSHEWSSEMLKSYPKPDTLLSVCQSKQIKIADCICSIGGKRVSENQTNSDTVSADSIAYYLELLKEKIAQLGGRSSNCVEEIRRRVNLLITTGLTQPSRLDW